MTRPIRIVALLAIAFGLPRLASAQHEHGEQLGHVTFPTSCNPAAQRAFEHAMALLHSFWWEESQGAFQAVLSADSTCAMGQWGLALTAWGNPFAGGPPQASESMRRGAAAAARATQLGAPTPREQGFLAAVQALYRDYATVPNPGRLRAYSDTLGRLYGDFPADPEVEIAYALSLVATAPKTDTTFTRQKRAAAILNPLFVRFPDHPGLAHYIIHANDSPQLAPLGLDAARSYAQIAPSAPHAQHMPSHIFIRLGLWDETIAANQRAFDAGFNYATAHHTGVAPEQLHALDYMVYADLQEGRDRDARAIVDRALALQTVLTNDAVVANYNRVAMEARLALERDDWKAASELPIRAGALTIGAALAHFTRGIGAACLGDTAAARAAIAGLAAIERDMTQRGDNDWARVVGIKRQLVTAWTEFAAGDTAAGLRDARAAADLEDVTEKQPITPGELLPARELLGDMLLAARRYGDARVAYTASLARERRRARSLYGAGRAAELAGDTAAARASYTDFVNQLAAGDGERAELARVKALLAGH